MTIQLKYITINVSSAGYVYMPNLVLVNIILPAQTDN